MVFEDFSAPPNPEEVDDLIAAYVETVVTVQQAGFPYDESPTDGRFYVTVPEKEDKANDNLRILLTALNDRLFVIDRILDQITDENVLIPLHEIS